MYIGKKEDVEKREGRSKKESVKKEWRKKRRNRNGGRREEWTKGGRKE